jgi:hypothetical protein
LPRKKTPPYGVQLKICCLISPTKLKDEVIGQNLPNLRAICQTLFAKKASNFACEKFALRMLTKSTPECSLSLLLLEQYKTGQNEESEY